MTPDDQYRLRFHEVESVFDGLMMTVRPALAGRGASFEDKSNRSGFDWTAPYYLWSGVFVEQEQRGSHTYRVAVWLEYLEALAPAHERSLSIRRRSEVFQTGKESAFVDEETDLVPLAGLGGEELVRRISAAIATGWLRVDGVRC